MAAVTATNIKRGQCIKYQNELGIVTDTEHRTPGKGNALIMATIRSLQSGKTKAIRFASDDKVDVIETDRQKLEYSYTDGMGYFFMDPVSFETVEIPARLLEDSIDLLIENLPVEVLFVEGNAVAADLPANVDLLITQSSEGIKGDTANNPQKPATLETGKVIQVPLFVKEGDRVRVDTRTGKYVSRV